MRQESLDLGLKPEQRLENFYAGPNQGVLELLNNWLLSVEPHLRPLPVYIWGEAGSGKTHLLKAVMNAARGSGKKGVYFTPEDLHLAGELVFDPSWELMVIDDVHLLSKEQEAMLFNWFINSLQPSDGRYRALLMSGDRPAADLIIREDLRTRIAGGLVYGLQVMGEQDRREVLVQQANLRGLALRAEVLDFMLVRFSRDLSSLVGWLDQLDRYALQTQRPITIPLIKDMLKDI